MTKKSIFKARMYFHLRPIVFIQAVSVALSSTGDFGGKKEKIRSSQNASNLWLSQQLSNAELKDYYKI